MHSIFSLHTFTYSITLTPCEYHNVQTTVSRYAGYPFKKNGCSIWYSGILSSCGVRVKLAAYFHPYAFYVLSLRINPRLLLGDSTFIGIYEPDRQAELITSIKACIVKVGLQENYYNYFRLERIDLCTNLFLKNSDYASLYIDLMKRGQNFDPMIKSYHYDAVSHRKVEYKNEVRYTAKNLEFVVYSKEEQMKDHLAYFKEVPKEACGLLRVELHCKRNWIIGYEREHNLPTTRLEILNDVANLSKKMLLRYVNGCFVDGMYYGLDELKSKIKKAFRSPLKERLIEFVSDVSTCRSLQRTLELPKWNNLGKIYIKKLEKANLNPVTIPIRKINSGTCLPSVSALLNAE